MIDLVNEVMKLILLLLLFVEVCLGVEFLEFEYL